MVINLNKIVSDALVPVNNWQEMVFTITKQFWKVDSREPLIIQERLVLNGKIQPAKPSEIVNFSEDALYSYKYYTVFINADISQIDSIRQNANDMFIMNDYVYKVVGSMSWNDAGWTKGLVYLIGKAVKLESDVSDIKLKVNESIDINITGNDKPLIIIKGDDNIQVDCNENTLTLSSNVDVNSFINIFCENSLGIIIPVLIRG